MNHETISYSQSWEDPDILLEALNIDSNDVVLSITSGGDNTLAILIAGPKEIHSVDKNTTQNYLLEIKLSAARNFSYDEYLEFLGVKKSNRRLALFEKIKHDISINASNWWSSNLVFIEKGLVNCGRFEQFISFFAHYIVPIAHSKKVIDEFQSFDDLEKQKQFFSKRWNSVMWKMIFKLFSSYSVLRKFARQNGMFTYFEGQENISDVYLKRFERLINSNLIKGNYFLHYSLLGNYENYVPPYIQKDNQKRLAYKSDSIISIKTVDLLSHLKSVPDNTYSKFNLSDVFESMSPSENRNLWNEIIRASKKGAIVAYWNNLVQRSYPSDLSSHFKNDERRLKEFRLKDKVFFYESFYFHTIIK